VQGKLLSGALLPWRHLKIFSTEVPQPQVDRYVGGTLPQLWSAVNPLQGFLRSRRTDLYGFEPVAPVWTA